jgi:hypothetical protein
VNLGLERPIQSEDLLGIGSWLLLQDSTDQPKDAIRAELSRLLGQLSLLKVLVLQTKETFKKYFNFKLLKFLSIPNFVAIMHG